MTADRHLWEICWVRDLALLVVAIVLLWVTYLTRSVTAAVLVAAVLAYIFNPLIMWADHRCHLPRWAAAGVILAVVILICTGFLFWAVPSLLGQIKLFGENLPRYIQYMGTRLGVEINWEQLFEQISSAAQTKLVGENNNTDVAQLGAYAEPVATAIRQIYIVILALLGAVVRVLTSLPVAVVIICFCFFFFSWHWVSITTWFGQFIPRHARTQTLDILGKMDQSVSAFIRGRLVQALVMGIVLSVGWWMSDVPYWLLLGLGCGMLNLIPFLAVVGYMLALVLAIVDSLTTGGGGFSWGVVIFPTVVYLLAQALDGWVMEPIVQGRATNLDPLTVLLAVLIGGTLAGLLGMLAAIPVAACIKILGQEVMVPRLRRYAEQHEPHGATKHEPPT